MDDPKDPGRPKPSRSGAAREERLENPSDILQADTAAFISHAQLEEAGSCTRGRFLDITQKRFQEGLPAALHQAGPDQNFATGIPHGLRCILDQVHAGLTYLSGVDLDMEAADLLRLQQAYSGCAKILQIAKETIDSILNII